MDVFKINDEEEEEDGDDDDDELGSFNLKFGCLVRNKCTVFRYFTSNFVGFDLDLLHLKVI